MLKEALQKAILVEVDVDDYREQYEEMLDEVYGTFMEMDASYILKECDPTAYRCGLLDYVDSLGIDDTYECPICDERYRDDYDATYCCQADPDDEEDDD